MTAEDNVVKLFEHDPLIESVVSEIVQIIYDRATGLSLATVIGILEFAKYEILEGAKDD